MDRRYTATMCECGDAFCAGCEDADVDRDEQNFSGGLGDDEDYTDELYKSNQPGDAAYR